MDHRAQEAPGLRAAVGVAVAKRARRRIALGRAAVLEPRGAVAERRHAETEHARADGRVRELVDPALGEAARQVDVAGVRDHALAFHAREAPCSRGNHLRRAVGLVAHHEDGARLLEIRGFVRLVAAVREQEVGHVHGRLELDVHAARQPSAVRAERFRSLEPKEAGHAGRKIALPAARHDDPAAPHEPAVAGVDGRMRVAARTEDRARGVVEVRHRDGVAAVHDVHDEAPARPRAIDGQQDRDVGREGDAPGRIARRQRQVGDGAIRRVLRIDSEVDPAHQLLVAAHVAERAPAGERAPLGHLKARDRHRTSW